MQVESTSDLLLLKKRKRDGAISQNKKQKRVVFQGFKSRLADISIKTASFDSSITSSSSLYETSTMETLRRVKTVNISEEFAAFYSEVVDLTPSLPILLHNLESFVDVLIVHLAHKTHGTGGVLEVLAGLAKDTRESLVPYFPRLVETVIGNLLQQNLDDSELIEDCFQCVAHLFRFLSKYVPVRECLKLFFVENLIRSRKSFLRQFAAEALSLVLVRFVVANDAASAVDAVMEFVAPSASDEDASAAKDFAATLFFETMRSKVEGAWHSTAPGVFGAVIGKSDLTVATGLFEKIRITIGYPQMLGVFGDEFIDAAASVSTELASSLAIAFLPSHRPKKTEDAQMVDGFVLNFIERFPDLLMSVDVRLRLASIARAVSNQQAPGSFTTWEALGVSATAEFFSEVEFPREIAGYEDATKLLKRTVVCEGPEVDVMTRKEAAECLATLGESIETSEWIQNLAFTSHTADASAAFWRLLSNAENRPQSLTDAAREFAIAKSGEESDREWCVAVAAALGCVAEISAADLATFLKVWWWSGAVMDVVAGRRQSIDPEMRMQLISVLLKADDVEVRRAALRMLGESDLATLEDSDISIGGERGRSAMCLRVSEGAATDASILTLLAQFRVPLAPVWDKASEALVVLSSSPLVWRWIRERLEFMEQSDVSIQQHKYSSFRATDRLTEKQQLWKVVSRVLAARGLEEAREVKWLWAQVRSMAKGRSFDGPVLAAGLDAVSCLKGGDVADEDRRFVLYMTSEKWLASWEPEVAAAAVRLLVGKDEGLQPFASELEKLASASNQSLFKRALEAFPMDKEDLQIDERVLRVVFRILFGKLSSRVKGLDKRGNIHTRRALIFGYLGQVNEEMMWLLSEVVLQGLVPTEVKVEWKNIQLSNWSEEHNSFLVPSTEGMTALVSNKAERATKLAVLESLEQVLVGVRMKLRSVIPAFLQSLVSVLVQSFNQEDWQGFRQATSCLADYVRVFGGEEQMEMTILGVLRPALNCLAEGLVRSKDARDVSASLSVVVELGKYEDTYMEFFQSGESEHELFRKLIDVRDYGSDAGKAVCDTLLRLCGVAVPSEEGSTSKANYGDAWMERRRRWKQSREEQDYMEEDEDQMQLVDGNTRAVYTLLGRPEVLATVLERLEEVLADRGTVEAIRVLECLARHCVTESFQASIAERMLQLLAGCGSGGWLKGETVLQTLKTIRALWQRTSRGPSLRDSVLLKLSLFLSNAKLLDLTGRQELALTIAEILDSSELGQLLIQMNKLMKGVATIQPDSDAHVVAFNRVSRELLAMDVRQGGLLLLRQSLFVLNIAEADFAVRNASERLMASLAEVCVEMGEVANAVRVALDGIYALLLSPEEIVQKSAMKTLETWLRTGALGEVHADLIEYTKQPENSDDYNCVLAELYDMQRHRRGRALAKILESADSKLTSLTLEKLVMPLAFHSILQRGVSKSSYDPNIAETCVALVEVVVRKLNKSPLPIFKLVTHQFMPRYPEREKMLIKCVRAMSQALKMRSDVVGEQSTLLSVKSLIDSLKNLVSVRITLKDKSMQGGADKSQQQSQQGGFMVKVRPDMVAAVTCLLPLVEDERSRMETLERVSVTCVQGLAARDLELRTAAREGLVSCGLVDPSRAAWISSTVRARLARGGYQTPVALYSVHHLLGRLWQSSEMTTLDDGKLVKELVELVKMDDERWWSQQSSHDTAVVNAKKTEGKQQVLEAKHNKLNVLLELVASHLSDESQRLALFDTIYVEAFTSKWLFTATPSQQHRFFRRVETQLYHVLKGRRLTSVDSGNVAISFTRMLAEGVRLLKARGRGPAVRPLFSGTTDADLQGNDDEETSNSTSKATTKKKNEERFLVASGAATGRRPTQAKTESFSSVNFRGRLLALFALRELGRNLQSCDEKEIGALVVDAIVVSGVEELLVTGAKVLGKLVSWKRQTFFSSKQQKQQLVKLLLNFVQSEQANRKMSSSVSVGVTCTKLLVALLERQDEFAGDGALVEAVAAHVLTVIDRATNAIGGGAETVAALQLYKRVVLGVNAKAELKSATCYEIGDKVGELIVVASDKRVAGLAGNVYAQYLGVVEHTEGALVKRIGTLVKHMMETDDLSRQNCINTLFMYVNMLKAKSKQVKFFEEKFASLVFLSAVAQLGVEQHVQNITMLQTLLTAVIGKLDRNVGDKLIQQVLGWTKNPALKAQLHVAALHVALLLSKDQTTVFSLATELVAKNDQTLTLPILGALNKLATTDVSACPSLLIDFVVSSALDSDDLSVVACALLAVPKLELSTLHKNSLVRKCLALLTHETHCERAVELIQAVLKVLASCVASSEPETLPVSDEDVQPSLEDEDLPVVDDEDTASEVSDESEESEELVESEEEEKEALVETKELGLLGQDEEIGASEVAKLKSTSRVWLMTRLSFLVRGLLARPSEAAVRLGAVVKLAVVMCESEILKPVLSILVRLATMRIFKKEEISDHTNVETLAGLISVPHTQRLGYVVKLAAEGLEAVERTFKRQGKSEEFASVMHEVRMAIVKTRTNRKIELKTMAVRAPDLFAKLKIKKSETKKLRKKIKRVDFISNKRKLVN